MRQIKYMTTFRTSRLPACLFWCLSLASAAVNMY